MERLLRPPPKPISPAEYDRIVARIGWAPARIAEIIGAGDPADILSTDQVRCLRALALDRELRDKVVELRLFFPELRMEAVRVVESSIP